MITIDNWVKSDRRNYRIKKSKIKDALEGATGILDGVTQKNKEDIFYMFLFCLCVPQSKAIKAEEAIDLLRKKHYYHYDLKRAEILEILKGRVRFHSTKSQRLIDAKKQFFSSDTCASVKNVGGKMSFWSALKNFYFQYTTSETDGERLKVLESARKWLVKNVNGMGMKLSSHFLRNIGMPGLAILDVHIIAGLQKRELVTEDDVKPLTNSQYEVVSDIMKKYADKVGITIDELDMLFWSQRTGYVFK